MKKPLFSLICAFALLFSSCSKEETVAPKDEKLYPVSFNVSTFSKQIVPIASLKSVGYISASTTSGNKLSDAIKYILYAVYNESGVKVNHKYLYDSDVNFGNIDDSLPKGKYKIVVVGSTIGGFSLPDTYNTGGYMNVSNGLGDIFLQQVDIEVAGEPISKDLQLKRIVGKVEIQVLDEIPVSIQEIAYSIKDVGRTLYLNGRDYGNGTITKSNLYYDHSPDGPGPDYTQDFSLYFFLGEYHSSTATVNIRAYDHNRNLVADKTIADVPVSINKKTILTGRLFDDVGSSNGQAFSISVDDKWNSESNHVEF